MKYMKIYFGITVLAATGCLAPASNSIDDTNSALNPEPESQCGSTWDGQDVEQYGGSTIPTSLVNQYQGSTGRLNGDCSGTLVGHDLFLTAGHCNPAVGDTVEFNYQFNNGSPPTMRPITTTNIQQVLESRNDGTYDYAIVQLSNSPGGAFGWRNVARRDPAAGTNLVIIQHPDGLPKQVATGSLVDYASSLGTNWFRHNVDTMGGTSGSGVLLWDGILVGIHTNAGCSETAPIGGNQALRISQLALGSARITNIANRYDNANLIGDVTGDGRADVVAINYANTWVLPSSGSAFSTPSQWSAVPFYGNETNLIGDVNADGRADVIAVNHSSTYILRSTGTAFAAPALWSSFPFYGSRATLAGDVTGDGRADLVAVNEGNTYVARSSGTSFNSPVLWSSVPFFGEHATRLADINGDGRDDLVAINSSNVWVSLSSGSGFGTPTLWSSTPIYGTRATELADVDGDGRADIVAINANNTYVARSLGSSFTTASLWTTTPFYGNRQTLVGDVTGDGRADGVALNGSGQYVQSSTGTSYAFPASWSTAPFFGNYR